MKLSMLSDKQLLGRLSTLCKVGRRIDVSVVLLLIEVEDRRLELQSAYPSLYEFCRQELGMSEGTTHRRVESARLVRRIPKLVDHLKRGTVTLSALALLRNHLTETNYEDLIARVFGKTRKQIGVVIAELSPRPDVVAQLRKLPTRARPTTTANAGAAEAPDVRSANELATPPTVTPPGSDRAAADRTPPISPPTRGRLEPLAPARWKLQLTAGQELHDKLERLQALMRHKNPSGDLAVIVEAAVDKLLQDLERTRRSTEGPSTVKTQAKKQGAVSAATRRAVFQRDGEQCTYVDAQGRRCGAKTFLEVDHIDPRARGGSGELPNLRLRCRPHNKLHAEQIFGRAHIAQRIAERTSKMEAVRPSDSPENERKRASRKVETPAPGSLYETGS